jgi:hypothetical protein
MLARPLEKITSADSTVDASRLDYETRPRPPVSARFNTLSGTYKFFPSVQLPP